jgi:hypothetical protein
MGERTAKQREDLRSVSMEQQQQQNPLYSVIAVPRCCQLHSVDAASALIRASRSASITFANPMISSCSIFPSSFLTNSPRLTNSWKWSQMRANASSFHPSLPWVSRPSLPVADCRRRKERRRVRAAAKSCPMGADAGLESEERSVGRDGRQRFTAVRGGGPCGQLRVVLELHAEELRIGRRAEQPARPHLMQVSGDDGLRTAIARCLPAAQSGGEEGAVTADCAFQACPALRGCAL